MTFLFVFNYLLTKCDIIFLCMKFIWSQKRSSPFLFPFFGNACRLSCSLVIALTFIHSFIHSGHFYSAPSSPLPLRGAPDYSTDTVSEFHAEAHRQLQVKDLPKVPT